MICTFFGHRDSPETIEPILKSALKELIVNRNVTLFYIGNHGNFDKLAKKVVIQLRKEYPYIQYTVVLAYMPHKKQPFGYIDFSNTIFPEELEKSPPKYAILKRNQWMLEHADYVITYVTHSIGSASAFKELAKRKGKMVINIAELC